MKIDYLYLLAGSRIIRSGEVENISNPSAAAVTRLGASLGQSQTEALEHLNQFHLDSGGEDGSVYFSKDGGYDTAKDTDINAGTPPDDFFVYMLARVVPTGAEEWFVAHPCDAPYASLTIPGVSARFYVGDDLVNFTPSGAGVSSNDAALLNIKNNGLVPKFAALFFQDKTSVDAANGWLADFGI